MKTFFVMAMISVALVGCESSSSGSPVSTSNVSRSENCTVNDVKVDCSTMKPTGNKPVEPTKPAKPVEPSNPTVVKTLEGKGSSRYEIKNGKLKFLDEVEVIVEDGKYDCSIYVEGGYSVEFFADANSLQLFHKHYTAVYLRKGDMPNEAKPILGEFESMNEKGTEITTMKISDEKIEINSSCTFY